jgi:hypothetical protein
MRGHRVVMVLAGVTAVSWVAPLVVTAPAAWGVARAGTWGTAIEVPGLASLSQDGPAQLASVSCGSAGNCAAVGSYTDGSGHGQAFVVSETNGKWHRAIEVPGSGILNAGGAAKATSVSCASAGSCAAAGSYTDGSGHGQAFVVSQTNGTWGKAIKVPGTGGLNKLGTSITPDLVSCASAGNCATVGPYTDGSGRFQVFVVSQTNGTWAKAIRMPFSGILNWGGSAQVTSVSCATAGNCAAGGSYRDRSGHYQAFVVSLTNGMWGTAIEVPGSEALNVGGPAGGFASVGSVSCASAGNCVAGGSYRDGFGHTQPFVAGEKNGAWGEAIKVPGPILNAGAGANVFSVSCATAGNCAVGGTYDDALGAQQAFVINERNGAWGEAIEMPGSGALNGERFAIVGSVSCTSAGNCAAGGFYMDGSDHEQAFVVSQTNGTWGTAIEIPGSGTLNAGGDARVASVSCTSAGRCAAGGTYTDGSGNTQAFVVNQA